MGLFSRQTFRAHLSEVALQIAPAFSLPYDVYLYMR